MLNQAFTPKNYLRLTKKVDPRNYKMGGKKEDYLAFHQGLTDELISSNFTITPVRPRKTKKGEMVILGTHHPVSEFALRKANDNLKRIFKIKPKNREQIVKQVEALLKEPVPFTVLKLDIKKFYENIPLETVLKKINDNPVPSSQTKKIVNTFYSNSRSGLHRGQAISSTLSELFLQKFDRTMAAHHSIYYYARFVDDIIIFTTKPKQDIERLAESSLPSGLKFNNKSDHIKKEFPPKGATAVEQTLEYLGYKFVIKSDKNKQVNIGIAESKLKKIKSRVICSLKRFCIDGDYDLLFERIKFLTGNYTINSNRKGLKSGIFYNYPLIEKHQLGEEDLRQLDIFLARSVLSKSGSLGSKLTGILSNSQRKKLIRLKFETGFKNKKTFKFTPEKIILIRKAWKHVT